jgi:hypothetical protein
VALTNQRTSKILLWLYSPLLGLGRFFRSLILYRVGRAPWTRDQPVAMPISIHRTTQTQNKGTQYRHPCLEWDSNPWSQRSSEWRQFMPYTARSLWSALRQYSKILNWNHYNANLVQLQAHSPCCRGLSSHATGCNDPWHIKYRWICMKMSKLGSASSKIKGYGVKTNGFRQM